jgi:hypothetical protein
MKKDAEGERLVLIDLNLRADAALQRLFDETGDAASISRDFTNEWRYELENIMAQLEMMRIQLGWSSVVD